MNNFKDLSLVSKYHQISPRKMFLIAEMIRNREVNGSLINLKNSCQKSSSIFYKLLNSARKQFVNRYFSSQSLPSPIYVIEVRVNKGPIAKKVSFRARGRTDITRERKCHVTITLRSSLKLNSINKEEEKNDGSKN